MRKIHTLNTEVRYNLFTKKHLYRVYFIIGPGSLGKLLTLHIARVIFFPACAIGKTETVSQ